MGLNKNQHLELHARIGAITDDRLRMLVQKALEHIDEDDLVDDEPSPRKRDYDDDWRRR